MFYPMPLKKLSVCSCGFTLLREEIQLGTVYHVDIEDRRTLLYICGGCGERALLECVKVQRRMDSAAGYLPVAAFSDQD
jgi:hypothetical protein